VKRCGRALAFILSVWTYGSEALDTLAQRSEWEAFSARLQCEVRQDHVWCKVDSRWFTINNEPLPIPWEVRQ
jgi:hypothetical protein